VSILANPTPPTCIVACGAVRKSGRVSTRAGKSYNGSGRGPLFLCAQLTIPPFNQSVSLLDAKPEHLAFVCAGLARFVATWSWEHSTTVSPFRGCFSSQNPARTSGV
jgi:hypothetical protein